MDDWLSDGDVPEADWGRRITKLAVRGGLAQGGGGLLFDLPALTQPYACLPDRCTPGRRQDTDRSCCADLDVGLTADEAARIEAALPRIAVEAADDPRWSDGPPTWHDDGALLRPGDRCVFALSSAEGLRCALHRVERADGLAPGSLKPTPCRLFPLAVVDLGDGRRLLTAVHRQTARWLAAPPARVFPCLASGSPPLYVSERDTIVAFFGEAAWDRLDRAARR